MELFFYGFTLWLGAYLRARDSQKATVKLTGWGLLAHALALAIQIIFNQFILLTPACYGSTRRSSFCQKKIKPVKCSSATTKSLACCYNYYRNLPFFFSFT
jgi:hypothetical protein